MPTQQVQMALSAEQVAQGETGFLVGMAFIALLLVLLNAVIPELFRGAMSRIGRQRPAMRGGLAREMPSRHFPPSPSISRSPLRSSASQHSPFASPSARSPLRSSPFPPPPVISSIDEDEDDDFDYDDYEEQ